MPSHRETPALADAADVLSDQLRIHLSRLAKVVRPHASALQERYDARLQQLDFEPRQRTALAALTLGAAARIVARGRRIQVFLEQVEYNGRRLAKLNLPPSYIVEALAEYDRLLTPALKEWLPEEHRNYQWVRDQLQFVVILTLNKAYYQVREREAQAFYELSRAELEARSLDDLLVGSLSVLTRFSGAREAHLFLLENHGAEWKLQASIGAGGKPRKTARKALRSVPAKGVRRLRLAEARCMDTGNRPSPAVLDPNWRGRFASVWSVPLLAGNTISGLMQFGFPKRYGWLPRELELLEAAAERCMVAAEKARLVEDLAAREEQIRKLAEHMLHIEEVERRRISGELHDEAGQSLLYIRLQLEMLEEEVARTHPNWKERVGGIREVAEHTIIETRRLIAALSPAVLDQLGLGAALRQLVRRFRQLHSCRVRLSLPPLDHLPKRIETVVYRIVQECCSNIAKHSQASNVNISLTSADELLRLNVEDDGVGFRVAEALKQRNSFGLAGMRERVTLLGGSFEIESMAATGPRRQKKGTRIKAELPIPRNR